MTPDLSNAIVGAQSLLGCQLIHDIPAGRLSGIIVETEAYSSEDAASHSHRGQTPRNAVMFGPAGYAYIYFTYGMHYCFNVVTGPVGQGQGVLIRALEPLEGVDLMAQHRPGVTHLQLTNGPAKLVQALAITKADYGANLSTSALRIEPFITPTDVVATTRIGIRHDTHRLWRFYIKDNPYVSKL